MTQIPIMGDGLPQPLLDMLGADFEVLAWNDDDSPALARAEALIAYGHPDSDHHPASGQRLEPHARTDDADDGGKSARRITRGPAPLRG